AVEPLVWDREQALRRLVELVEPARGTVACDVFSPALCRAIGRPLIDAMPLLAEAAAARTAGEVEAVQTALRAARSALRAAGRAGDTVAVGGGDLTAARRAWFAALCAVAKRCRAGATAADLRAAAIALGARQQELLAHGLGIGIEPPFVDLESEDAEPLRAGTVLVLAPVVGGFRATRALVVTEGSPRWLEEAP